MAVYMKDSRRKNKARFTTDDFEAKVNYKIRFSDTGLKSGAKTKSLKVMRFQNEWILYMYKVILDGGIF